MASLEEQLLKRSLVVIETEQARERMRCMQWLAHYNNNGDFGWDDLINAISTGKRYEK